MGKKNLLATGDELNWKFDTIMFTSEMSRFLEERCFKQIAS